MQLRTNNLSKEQINRIEALMEQFSGEDSFAGLKSPNNVSGRGKF